MAYKNNCWTLYRCHGSYYIGRDVGEASRAVTRAGGRIDCLADVVNVRRSSPEYAEYFRAAEKGDKIKLEGEEYEKKS